MNDIWKDKLVVHMEGYWHLVHQHKPETVCGRATVSFAGITKGFRHEQVCQLCLWSKVKPVLTVFDL